MQLKYNFWYFEKALKDTFIKKLIKEGIKKNPGLGVINKYQGKKITSKMEKDLKKTRDSNVAFLNNKWIYDGIDQFFKVANHNAGWNFKYDFYESVQFTVYAKGQHYDWHADSNPIPYPKNADPNFAGKIRKLSASISLNDASEYEGGDFQLDLSTPLEKKKIITIKELRKKGSIVIFPSHQYHKVTPVTKGVRYSLVIWGLGYPWQ